MTECGKNKVVTKVKNNSSNRYRFFGRQYSTYISTCTVPFIVCHGVNHKADIAQGFYDLLSQPAKYQTSEVHLHRRAGFNVVELGMNPSS